MYISRIEITDFKSYKGKNILNGLSPNFNCVVGPNGSGKSNVIDAVQFALGSRASKLRHQKLSDLVNASSRNECSVAVTFKNEAEELEIRRTMVNGSSVYRLNGSEISIDAVHDELRKRNVDFSKARPIILQGEIESIATMKPHALLDYIENAVGTSHYAQAIAECTDAHTKLESELALQERTLKNHESVFHTFTTEKESYDRRKIDELKLQEAEAQLYSKLAYALKERSRQIEDEKKEIKKSIKESNKEKYESELKEKERESEKLKIELRDLQERESELQNKFKRVRAVYSSIDTALVRSTERLSQWQTQEEEKKKKRREASDELDSLTREKKDRVVEVDALTREVNELREKINKTKLSRTNQAAPIQAQIETATKEVADEMQKLSEVSTRIEIHKQKLKKYESDRLDVLRRKKEGSSTTNDCYARLNDISSERSKKESELLDIDKALDSLNNDKHSIEREHEAVMQKLNALYENDRENRTAEGILKHMNFPGIHGRLGDLGSVDKRYDVAIGTACGALSNIVVEDTATAQRCVELLRTRKLGRATFIILNKLEGVKPYNGEGQRLCDLVQVEPRFAPCFYFALRDTLVAEDLEEAKRLAFGSSRRRVVTLDGKLIEKTGAMSGGKAVRSGMKAPTSQQKERSSLERVSKEIAVARDNIFGLLIEQERLHTQKQTELSRLADEEEALKQTIESYANVEEIDESKEERTREKLNELIVESSDLEKRTKKKRTRIDDLTEKLSKLYGAELESIEERTEYAQSELSVHRERMALIEQRIMVLNGVLRSAESSSPREKERLEAERENLHSEKQILSTNLEKLSEELNACVAQRKSDEALEEQLAKSLALCRDNCKETMMKINSLKQKSLEIEAEEHELRSKQATLPPRVVPRDLDESLEELEGTVNSLRSVLLATSVSSSVVKRYEEANLALNNERMRFETLSSAEKSAREKLDELCKQRREEFSVGFGKIAKKFKKIYQLLTFSGNAELEFVDPLDPFSSGVSMSVMPPKKSWKSVSNLSGGEKTLSSLSMVFALNVYLKAPVCVMDEIDAALDVRNVSLIGRYVREASSKTQFIVISLREPMYVNGDTLIGVYKTENDSKVVICR